MTTFDVAAVPSMNWMNAGLAILRIVTGIVFIAHGAQKLFVWGPASVAQGFDAAGIPLAAIAGPAVALLEFFGGIALVLGLLTRITSAGLAVVMLGAALTVHLAGGFFMPNGIEFVLTLFAAAVALALIGPGSFSVDALVASRLGRVRLGESRDR